MDDDLLPLLADDTPDLYDEAAGPSSPEAQQQAREAAQRAERRSRLFWRALPFLVLSAFVGFGVWAYLVLPAK